MKTQPNPLATTLIFSAAAAGAIALAADAPKSIRWEKKHLIPDFFSEGAAFGDFNKDGKMDVVSGPYWWEGPAFEAKHEIYEPKPYPPKGYSDNFLSYAYDINGDGWDDYLVLGFPGADAFWFKNPQGKEGRWERFNILNPVDNESPHFADITGDGKPEIICSQNGVFGYAEMGEDPEKPWAFTKISAEGATGGKFTHGLGIGDVNGDGRMDLLEKGSWLEQPENAKAGEPWAAHTFAFSGPGGAQMFAYDFDGDGDNDILTSLAAHAYGLAWYEQADRGDGTKGFNKHVILNEKDEPNADGISFSQLHSIDLRDIDGDGVKDVVTGKRFWAHNGNDPGGNDPAVLYWFKVVPGGRSGEASFVPHQIDADSGVGTQVMAGDVTGDGAPDIIVGNKKGTFVHVQKRE